MVNASKSSFVLLGNTKNSDYLQDIILNNVKLDHTSSTTKLLGLHIQTDLAWKEHITLLLRVCPLFLRLSKFFKFDILCKLCFTLFVPHLDYCITMWGNSPFSRTDILQKLQNRLTRIITKNYNYQICRLVIVKQLGWMNVKECYFVATFMFKYYHSAIPPNLRHFFLSLCDKHNYSTRSATFTCLSLPKQHTELLKISLLYSGPFVWNGLPNHLKQATSILSFKLL